MNKNFPFIQLAILLLPFCSLRKFSDIKLNCFFLVDTLAQGYYKGFKSVFII